MRVDRRHVRDRRPGQGARGSASSAGSTGRTRRRVRRPGADAGAAEAARFRTPSRCDRARAWRRSRCRTRRSNRRRWTPTTRTSAASSPSPRIRRPATRCGSGSRFPRRTGTDVSSAPAAAGSPAATPNGVNQPVGAGICGRRDRHRTRRRQRQLSRSTRSGRLNWQAIRNFAHVGIHEMTVTGKALTQAMYGVAPRYSYFNGCSTGGRQGLMEAQRYPQDYDGIVAGGAGDQLDQPADAVALGLDADERGVESRRRRASWPRRRRRPSPPATASTA